MKRVCLFFFILFNFNSFVFGVENQANYPEWFLNIPHSQDKIYAVGTAQKEKQALGIEAAAARARSELARQIETRVSTLIEDFIMEAGNARQKKVIQFTRSISRQLSDIVLSGSKVDKTHIDHSTEPNTCYVLVFIKEKMIKQHVNQAVVKNKKQYSRLGVNKDLPDLMDNIEAWSLADQSADTGPAYPAAEQGTVGLKKGKKPAWIKRIPGSNDYYIGIGKGTTLQTSQDRAINMLVSQIRVAIQSEINDFMKETNGITEEQVSQHIKISVKESVEDLELVEAYHAPEEGYWSYYRLSREKYQQKQREKMENSKKNALDFLTKSDLENDPALSLKYALLGFFHIGQYVNKAVKVNYKGREVILINELTTRIQQHLNQFNLSVLTEDLSIDPISQQALAVKIKLHSGGKAVRNLPVIFRNNKGKLELSSHSTTDNSGLVTCIIKKALDKTEKQSFIVQPDILAYIRESIKDEDVAKVYLKRIMSLGLPTKEIIIRLKPPLFRFTLKTGNDLAGNSRYASKLKALTVEFKNKFEQVTGAKFTDQLVKYHLSMQIDGTTSKSELSGSYFTRLTVIVKIIDTRLDQEVYSTATPQIKGGSTTETKSVQSAINNYIKKYNQEFVQNILDFFDNQ